MTPEELANLVNNATSALANNATTAPLLAGKYKDITELERGYQNQQSETQKIIQQRNELQAKLDAVLPLLGNDGVAGRMPGRAAPTSAIEAVSETIGVTKEQLRLAMVEAAHEALAPFTQGIAARQSVLAENPEFGQFEPEIAQFLNASPEANQLVSDTMRANPKAGMKLALYEYQRAAARTQNNATTDGDASGQSQFNARVDAMIPAPGAAREVQNQNAHQIKLQALRTQAERDGKWEEFLAEWMQTPADHLA